MEMTSENRRQSAIEENSPIGDLNEVAAVSDVETEPEVVTDGGAVVSGVGAPPDSTQTAPLLVVVVEEDGGVAFDVVEGGDGREIAPILIDEEDVVVDGDGDGDGDGGAGFVIDLNSDEIHYPNEAIQEGVAIEIMVVIGEENVGGELNGEPDRKRVRYGGGDGAGGGYDGEPSEQQQPNNNLRLFGIDINSGNQEDGGGNGFNAGAVAGGGGGSPSIQPSVIGLQEEDDGDVISSGGGGGGGGGGAVDDGDGGESSSQQPKSGLRLFGNDI